MGKRIKVRVDKKGGVKVEMEGYAGAACLETLRKILRGLGKVETLTPTAEYYEPATNTSVVEYE